MARPQNSPILDQLRNAKTFSEQSDSLQALKNEIVGHIQKKEAWVALGVLEPIVLSLTSNRSPAKSNTRDAYPPQQSQKPPPEEDRVRLQALQIIASFANGGPAFLQPLHVAGALPAILTCISPNANAPQIVVASLKALTCIANASALALPSNPLDLSTLADNILSSQHLESFCLMLATTSPKHISQSQLSLAAGLICRLCREERHQNALAACGVLDMLATQLASFAVAKGQVVPGAEEEAYSSQLFEIFPKQAHPGAKIGPILEAISVILGDSKYRSTRLVNSPAMLAVFPCIRFHPVDGSIAAKKSRGRITAMEYLLPTIPSAVPQTWLNSYHVEGTYRSDLGTPSKLFPDRFGFASELWDETQVDMGSTGAGGGGGEDVESPLIPWLIIQVRLSRGYEQLMAAAVLTALYKAGLGRPSTRETTIGLLVVPALVDLIAKNIKDEDTSGDSVNTTQRLILERAPAVLARLITDSEYLQKAAFKCSAVKTLTSLLRRAYEPVNLEQTRAWSPRPDKGISGAQWPSASSQLGGGVGGGQNPLLTHRLRLREAALRAIGTLASGKDDYRKAFAEEDFVPYVVESLTMHPSKPRQIKDRRKDKASNHEATLAASSSGYGTNPVSVIIAGCHVVRMLARSISILRTLLVDHAVALPVLRFMKHADVNVQIAATAAICNLVVEVSPVRELLIENGAMLILCEHTHSDNAALRLNALWALKHLVVALNPEMKKACLEQLQPGWLVQLIDSDGSEASSYHTRLKQSAAADDVDEEMDAPPPDEPFRWLYVANGVLRELDASRSSRLRQVENTLASIQESELNPAKKARNDDVAIQEQGLDLIRNLIGPGVGVTAESPYETTEMIDYLLNALGQERFFEILTSKLHAKVLNPYLRRSSGPGRETRVVHPQAKIIAAVIFILVHIAASTFRHREMIISQTALLKQLAHQAGSKEKEVRVALCHLVINLTGQEEEEDSDPWGWSRRAIELKRLGFHAKMEKLQQHDRDLDVRERAKTAAWQLEKATAY